MDQLMAAILLIAVALAAISAALSVGLPAIESSKSTVSVDQGKDSLEFVGNAIREVASEAENAARIIELRSPGSFMTLIGEDAVEFEAEVRTDEEYLSRKFNGNIETIYGNDVSCSDSANLTLENTYLKAVLLMYNETQPIHTDNFLVSLEEKTGNTVLEIVNSSIEIDNDPSTRNATGYSELLRSGTALPSCTAHFFVNSTSLQYDVYYTLYAGADFLVMEVRNII